MNDDNSSGPIIQGGGGGGLVFQHGGVCVLLPRPHRGRARYCNAHVCLFVCVFVCVCLCVCLFVCLFVRVFAKFQCVISQPFLNRSL